MDTLGSKSNLCRLTVNEISLQASLGCLDEERLRRQPIKIKIIFDFQNNLKALTSDSLEDTICYDVITQNMKAHLEGRHFKLVEHLTYSLHTLLKPNIPEGVKFCLYVTKVNPPVDEITSGVTFAFGDDLSL